MEGVSNGDQGAVARRGSDEPGIVGRMLDAGAMAVVAPMIESADDARQLVAACRYPPAGRRSLGPIRAMARDGAGYITTANDRVCVLPMIETAAALEAVEEIAAVEGVDGLLVGPFDLSMALGLPPGDNDGKEGWQLEIEAPSPHSTSFPPPPMRRSPSAPPSRVSAAEDPKMTSAPAPPLNRPPPP